MQGVERRLTNKKMQSKLVGAWLLGTSLGTFGLIVYGGYTRLKRAGLSMVQWRPLTFTRPSSEEQWEIEYAKYQEFPEFKTSPDITLDDFKQIYNIEWTHRQYARFLGLAYAAPMALFWQRGFFDRTMKIRSMGMLGLFGV